MLLPTLATVALHVAIPATEPDPGPLTIAGEVPPYDVWHHMVMPGERVPISLPRGYRASIDGSPVADAWVADDTPGTYDLKVRDGAGALAYEAAIFVLEPASNIDGNRRLNGYRIGTYPADTPQGFIRFGPNSDDVRVSPSFRLGQFICKQQPDHFPKYLLVSPPNLERLETLLAALKADGLTDADTFFVMSGYRTPFYNTAIKSATRSRHMYGDATDVYLDHDPRDGVMDDVNGDGRITKADADFLYDYAAKLFAEAEVEAGGLGSYRANAVHGPFLHVDGRGRAARWGR